MKPFTVRLARLVREKLAEVNDPQDMLGLAILADGLERLDDLNTEDAQCLMFEALIALNVMQSYNGYP